MIFIALGANLPSRFGSPEETLKAAQAEMGVRGIRVVKASSVWLTAPVPVSEQPWYRNAVVAVQTDLEPVSLLKVLKEMERDFGRCESERNAARVIDLDILVYDGEIVEEEGCVIPHLRMQERAFVLYPLQEVASADWVHPALQLSVGKMIANLPAGQALEKLVDISRKGAA